MKNGTFLKENQDPQRKDISQLSLQRQQARKAKAQHKKNRLKQLWILSGVLAVLLAVLLIILAVLNRSSPLEGRWYVDDVTAYEFYDASSGALVLPTAEYPFRYSVKDDVMEIDFEYEGAKDARYTYTINGDTLILNGGNSTMQSELILKKSK